MNQEATKGPSPLRSLVFLRCNVCPKNVKIFGIICNGIKTKIKLRVNCETLYKGFPYIKLPKSCHCCGSSYGVLALADGEIYLMCVGLSCMKKHKEFLET